MLTRSRICSPCALHPARAAVPRYRVIHGRAFNAGHAFARSSTPPVQRDHASVPLLLRRPVGLSIGPEVVGPSWCILGRLVSILDGVHSLPIANG